MTLVRRQSPLVDLVTARDLMERMLDDRFLRPIWPWVGERERLPALDLYTTPDAVIARIALPGVKPEGVEVTIADDLVTIRGSYEQEEETNETGYVRRDLLRGSIERAFEVPMAIKADTSTATLKDGLLTLTLPKSDDVKPKHLKVEVSR